MAASTSSPGSSRGSGGGRGVWLGVGVALIAVVAVVVLMSRSRQIAPFTIDSTRPDGFAALAILLEDQGATVESHPAASLLGDEEGSSVVSDSEVIVVAAPSYATAAELDALIAAAEAGATVVLGEPGVIVADSEGGFATAEGADSEDDLETMFPSEFEIDDRTLADTEGLETAPGECDIEALDGLGDIDAAFAASFSVPPILQRCYTDGFGSLFSLGVAGSGSIATIGSPYLWVNARLQPAKELGGAPLDNAATALRLTDSGPGTTVTFIDPVPSPGAPLDGTKGPVELLPVSVKLALVQLVAAFLLFVWWRSRRLGAPISERLPVEIAGSELVVAVGDLLRRRGSPQRAAAALREDTRRVLAARLGMVGASDAQLVTVVAARTGRAESEVAAALLHSGSINSADSLVRLARSLDTIRQEVLSVSAHS